MSETDRRDGAVPQRVFCDDATVSTYETQAEAERRVRRVGQPAWDAGEIARSALGELGPKRRVALMAELLCEMHGLEAVELLSKVRAAVSLRMQELIDLHMGVLDGVDAAAPATDTEILRRAVAADDAYSEMRAVVREMRDENLRQGGDDIRLGQLLCAHLVHMLPAIPVRKAGLQ